MGIRLRSSFEPVTMQFIGCERRQCFACKCLRLAASEDMQTQGAARIAPNQLLQVQGSHCLAFVVTTSNRPLMFVPRLEEIKKSLEPLGTIIGTTGLPGPDARWLRLGYSCHKLQLPTEFRSSMNTQGIFYASMPGA